MRTTLDLDDDLLSTAKQIAKEKGTTAGQVISELAKQSLAARKPLTVRNGALLFVPRPDAGKPGLRIVNELRDDS